MSDTSDGPRPPRAERTGIAAVDDVLTTVDDLDGRPLEDHAEVFEQAHQRLRRALDEVDQVTPTDVDGGSAEPGR